MRYSTLSPSSLFRTLATVPTPPTCMLGEIENARIFAIHIPPERKPSAKVGNSINLNRPNVFHHLISKNYILSTTPFPFLPSFIFLANDNSFKFAPLGSTQQFSNDNIHFCLIVFKISLYETVLLFKYNLVKCN